MAQTTIAANRTPQDRTPQWSARAPLYLILAALLVSLLVTTLTRQSDALRNHTGQPLAEIALLEASSHLVIAALAVALDQLLPRLAHLGLRRRLAVLVAGFVPFLTLHVAATYGLRALAFPAMVGRPYELGPFEAQTWLYEAPKDLAAYGLLVIALIAGQVFAARREAQAAAPAAPPGRIVLRDGAATHVLAPDEIVLVQAAGNYLEVHTAARAFLPRMSLTELQRRLEALGDRHVRVHRSFLVHLDHVRAVAPTGEGDVAITLSTGRVVPGSRRYRDRLGALAGRQNP